MAVSDEDVAHVRRVYEEFDIEALRAGGLRAYVERFYDDDVVVEAAEGFPITTLRHVGHDGYIEWFEANYAPYADVRWELESVSAVGERVVAVARVRGRVPGDPTELEVRLANVYRMHAGRIAHVLVFLTPELAVEAARAAERT
jgi:ketosteroid isomerase-like protein